MDTATKLFKTSAFGFNRSDVINYIEKTKNDFYDYRIQTQRTIEDLNEKIKELEASLKSKDNLISENKSADSLDFSSSVSQINEAADHLRETADKICDDIGDFLDKILTADREAFIENEFYEDKADEIFPETEIESSDISAETDINNEISGFMSQFSQIIDNAFIEKGPEEAYTENEQAVAPSILDGLLGSSVFSK